MIASFGSYYCGGTTIDVAGRTPRTVAVTAQVELMVDENGRYAVGHAYGQFFIPAARNTAPPVVLLHGGGLCGTVWEQTPDGRTGWLHRLLAHGYEVHVVDSVERGRAGWSPFVTPEPPLTRTLQDAWTLFRFGPAEGYDARAPFPNQQFPVEYLEAFGRFFVPRWVSQGQAQIAAFAAVLRRIGRAIVICHSQGAETAFGAAALAPERVARIIAIEPSSSPLEGSPTLAIPLALVHGDHLDTAPIWRDALERWTRHLALARAAGAPAERIDLNGLAPGSSHMPMHDRNSDAVLDHILGSLPFD